MRSNDTLWDQPYLRVWGVLIVLRPPFYLPFMHTLVYPHTPVYSPPGWHTVLSLAFAMFVG
jgi:hypothetical protein